MNEHNPQIQIDYPNERTKEILKEFKIHKFSGVELGLVTCGIFSKSNLRTYEKLIAEKFTLFSRLTLFRLLDAYDNVDHKDHHISRECLNAIILYTIFKELEK